MAESFGKFSDALTDVFFADLVDPGTNTVFCDTAVELHRFLRSRGFALIKKKPWGPKTREGRHLGEMLFYVTRFFEQYRRGFLVRVKTHGDAGGRWTGIPHVDVSWVEGGTDLENELGKYDSSGSLQWYRAPCRDKKWNKCWGARTHMRLSRVLHDARLLSTDEEEPWAGHA